MGLENHAVVEFSPSICKALGLTPYANKQNGNKREIQGIVSARKASAGMEWWHREMECEGLLGSDRKG